MPIPLPLAELVLGAGRELINRIWPNPIEQAKERAEAEFKLLELTQSERMADKVNDTSIALAQAKINEKEAESASGFKSNWRPAAGWVCVAGFLYQVAYPFLVWYSSMHGLAVPPAADAEGLMTLLFGILGLGAYRTYEKVKRGTGNDSKN